MAISETTPIFPNNAVLILSDAFATIWNDGERHVWMRPLRTTDPHECIGVYGTLWTPDQDSAEIVGHVPAVPTVQHYRISIQALIRDGDEERGLAKHSVLSGLVRQMLYTDPILSLALRSLAVTSGGVTEQVTKWEIKDQRLLSNEVTGDWIFLSVAETVFDTQTN